MANKVEDIVNLVLTAVALAMGIVSIVLPFVGQEIPIILMPLGLTCIALARLQVVAKKVK